LAAKEILGHPHRYGFEVPDDLLYEIEPVKYVSVTKDVGNWITWSQQQGINFKLLKRHNPWIQSNSLDVGSGKEYLVAIPIN
jgi:membrane-bound lytic murein transglycosylase D